MQMEEDTGPRVRIPQTDVAACAECLEWNV